MSTSSPRAIGPIMLITALVLALAGVAPAAAKQWSAWGAPNNVESIPGTSDSFNTAYTDGCPIQSPDGLRFYMASNRPGGSGGLDIWVAARDSVDDPWGPPENLGTPVNSSADDYCPTPVPGRRLFFVSARAGGCGGADIYLSRLTPSDEWGDPANLGCQVNSAAGEAGPSLVTADGDQALYFSSTRPGGVTTDAGTSGDADIYRSPLLADGSFGDASLVEALSSEAEDARPNVRKDGLEVVLDSTRPGTLGGPDIFVATRTSTVAPWGAPVDLGSNVNTSANETRASFSRDGSTLYFGSNRPGSEPATTGAPSNDIYVTTRST